MPDRADDLGDPEDGPAGPGPGDADGSGDDARLHRLPFRPGEQRLLTRLVHDLRLLLVDGDDPSLAVLHRSAYVGDEDGEAAWQLLAGSELDDQRLAGLAVVERSLERGSATADELHTWMTTINAARLVLGTQLGIDEDRHEADLDGPDGDRWAVYEWLGGALLWVVDELSGG